MSSADQRKPVGASAYWLYSWPRRYGFALVVIILAALVRYGLDVEFGFIQPFILFYPLIMLIALLGGFGVAVFATFFSAGLAGYFFMEPLNSFTISNRRDIVGLALFVAMGVTISWFGDLFRRRAIRLKEFEKAVEGLEEMIVVVDRDYRYVIANRAFLNYRGLRTEDLVGSPIQELLNPGVFETTVKEKLDKCFRGQIVQYETRYTYPTRGERDLLVWYLPIEGTGGVDRVACVLRDVTDQKQADRSLKLFRALMDQSNDAVEVVDPETLRFLDVNEKACKDLGYSREELLGMSVFDVNPELDESERTKVQAKLRESGYVVQEAFHQRKDGSIFPVEISLKHVELDRSYIIAVARDITERKRADQELAESEKRFRAVYERSPVGIALVDPESGRFLDMNPRFCEILGRRKEDALKVDFQSVTHPDDLADSLARRKEFSEGRSTTFELDKRYCCPDGREVWAHVSITPMWREQEPKKVHLVMARDITESKRAEEALRRSERRYRLLFEENVAGVAICDIEGQVLDCNGAWARILGYDCADEVRGRQTAEFYFKPAERHRLLTELGREGMFLGREMQLLRKDGSPVWVVFNCVVHSAEGGTPLVQATAIDVTKRVQAEAASHGSERRYRMLFEKGVAGVGILSMGGLVVDCNAAWARIFGHGSAMESCGRQIAECYADPAERDVLLGELQRNGAFFNRELELRRKDGTPFWILLNSALLSEGQYPPLIQSTVLDITERKRAEDALRRREEDYRRFVAQSSEGIFREDLMIPVPVDLPEDEVVARIRRDAYVAECNDALAKMYGFGSAQELVGKRLAEMLVPDDLGNLESMREFVRSGFRLLERSSREVDQHGNGKIFLNSMIGILEEGKLVRTWGIQRDVTERVKAEEGLRATEQSLRESEERFRVALKDSPITVFNQDRELRYTWIYNPQLYWQHESIGRTDEEIVGPKKVSGLVALKRRVLKTGVALREEVVIPNDGKNYAFDVTIEPLFDAEGNVIGITGAAMDIARLREMSDRLQDARDKLAREKTYLEGEIQAELGFEEIIGQSPALSEVLKNVRVVAPTDSTVLLLGETGTGKELVARSVHALSARHDKAFIKLNCAAVPSGLLESELFGHEKGAFTSAVSQKVGRIELADKGTLFLDEIGELPVELQPKLLRVLQDREFERLGGIHTLHVDVRIISATNRDLRQDIADKKFREDLFYRLNVFPISLPSLRERRTDIPILVQHFVRKHSARMGKRIDSVSPETMVLLQKWNWAGNIRELENMIERMVILSKGRVLSAPPAEMVTPPDDAEDSLTEMEREHIIRVLRETNGVLSGMDGAASRLGIKRTTLQSMIKRHGIELQDYRRGNGTFGAS